MLQQLKTALRQLIRELYGEVLPTGGHWQKVEALADDPQEEK